MQGRWVLLTIGLGLGVFLGCGPSSQGGGAAASDASAGSCTSSIDGIVARPCTRCWPATRALCEQGRANVVQGIAACLTGNNVCWDLYDPNSAGPCMQAIIDANADAQVKAVQAKRTSLGCPSWDVLGSGALASMMSDADRVKFATCVSSLATCDTTALGACFSGTAFNQSLCH